MDDRVKEQVMSVRRIAVSATDVAIHFNRPSNHVNCLPGEFAPGVQGP